MNKHECTSCGNYFDESEMIQCSCCSEWVCENVLVYDDDFNKVSMCYWVGGNLWKDSSGNDLYSIGVSFWQPLPKPPKQNPIS